MIDGAGKVRGGIRDTEGAESGMIMEGSKFYCQFAALSVEGDGKMMARNLFLLKCPVITDPVEQKFG